MLFWMRPESHVAAAKIVRSSRRCLIGASFILHRTSSARRHPASRTPARSRRALRIAPPLVRRASLPQQRALVAVRLLVEPGHDTLDALGRVGVRGPLDAAAGARLERRRSLAEGRASRTRERTVPGVGYEPAPVRMILHEARVLEAVHARRAPRELRRGRRGNDGVFPSRRAARREDPGVGDEPAPAQALACIWCRLCERLGELRGLSAPNARPRALPCSKSSASRD